MRIWIATALLALAVLDVELGNLAARWESRSYNTPSAAVEQDQALMDAPEGFPPK